ncbi:MULTISPECIES: PadR family transcriptional regulator [Parafrankia]|uniref:PadR family transcriptional regulator n=1 Tax=Parafrankia TaxID=2994362 RepID=UPI000A95B648|nr:MULTISPECIES: PadR family transcriptional regulator [Parafrankia]MBE3201789.1 PadR family transcriptional regulator [Parafrankia sp. CH37]
MPDPTRVTGPLLDVLEAFLDAMQKSEELHGWVISRSTGRSGPTVYGILDRLEDLGWVTGRWEEPPVEPSRPRRRLYVLSAEGAAAARELLAERRGSSNRRGVVRPAESGPARPSDALRGLSFTGAWRRFVLFGGAR